MRATALLALASLALVAGCVPDPAAGKIVLRVSTWHGAREGNAYDLELDRIYRDFERQNPGVLVREESTPSDYLAKMSLAYVADAQPDVMLVDASSAAQFIENRMVDDLTPRIRADRSFHLDDFYPNAVDAARRGDAVFAVPLDFTPMVLYYNKRLFDRADVAYPTGDWNFAQFRAAAKRLTLRDKSGETTQYGFTFSNWPAAWVLWVWNNGTDHVAPDGKSVKGYLDSPKAAQTVAFLRDLVQKDQVSPSQSQMAAMGVNLFASGKSAMVVTGHWSLVDYASAPKGPDGKPKIELEDLGVAPLPHNTPTSNSVIYESGFGLSAKGRHKDLAWRFIKYMTSRAVQTRYQASGIAVCGRKDVAEERARSSTLEAQFLPIIPAARAPYGARIEQYAAIEEGMQRAMDGVLSSGRDPQAALTKAAGEIEREFAKR